MKKQLALSSSYPSYIGQHLHEEFSTFFPAHVPTGSKLKQLKNELSNKLSNAEKERLHRIDEFLHSQDTYLQQSFNAELLLERAPNMFYASTTKQSALRPYLESLYLFDRQTKTLEEIRRLVPLALENDKPILLLYELDTYSSLVIDKKLPPPLDEKTIKEIQGKLTEVCNSTTFKTDQARLSIVIPNVLRLFDYRLPQEARVSWWSHLLQLPIGNLIIKTASTGKYTGVPKDTLLPLNQRITYSLTTCFESASLYPAQRDLLRLLINKGLNQSWLGHSLIFSALSKLQENGMTPIEKKQIKEDLILLQNKNLDTSSSIVLALILFPNDKKFPFSNYDFSAHLNDPVGYDSNYVYVAEYLAQLKQQIDPLVIPLKQLYCDEIALRYLKSNQIDKAISWFTTSLHLDGEKGAPLGRFDTLLALHIKRNDFLSAYVIGAHINFSLGLDRSDLNILRTKLAEQLKSFCGLDAFDEGIIQHSCTFEPHPDTPFIIHSISFEINGTPYTVHSKDILGLDLKPSSKDPSPPSVELPISTTLETTIKINTTCDSPATTLGPIPDQLVRQGPKVKTRPEPVSSNLEDNRIAPELELEENKATPLQNEPNIAPFIEPISLSMFKNMNAREYRAWLETVPGFVGISPKGRRGHDVVTIRTEEGEKKFRVPNYHGGTIPLSAPKEILNSLSKNSKGL